MPERQPTSPAKPKRKHSKEPTSGTRHPKNKFLLFRASVEESVKREMPGSRFAQRSKEIGRIWRQLPRAEKEY
ncbi:hypothetical protein SLS62_003360 [Diatrype stigma]|uniref:HMG box domain-containing protein n=1 Tax=Diatrype stigma TaxID=117547 RepID=A0AAN9YU03_9PEZI